MNQLGPALWQNLRFGMSPREVQKAQPAAIPNSAAAPLTNGATDDLIIPAFELSGQLFVVHLYILDQRLAQVTLTLDAPHDLNPAHRILGLLRSKYGPELILALETELLPQLIAEWLTDEGVDITLLCFQGAVLNVVYQVRNESDKL